MAQLCRAELLRLRSGRVLVTLLGIAVFLNALSIVGSAGAEVDAMRAAQTTAADASHQMIRLGFGGLLFATLFGALMTTSEFRHGSIGRSLFNAGRPERLMAAKFMAASVGGIAFGAAAAAGAVLTSALVLELHGEQLVLDRESQLIALGVFAVSALAAPWGMLLGWVLRSQIAALGGIMAWTLIAESAIIALAPGVGRFLPGGAQASIYRQFDSGDVLATPWGYALFAAWLAVAAVAAVALVRRRDLA